MEMTVARLTINGFKSIRELTEFELKPLNVLIGPNGAGKSNFIELFEFLREMLEQRLQCAVARAGGAAALLWLGREQTRRISGRIDFGRSVYEFELTSTDENFLFFAREAVTCGEGSNAVVRSFGSGHAESRLKDWLKSPGRERAVQVAVGSILDAVSRWGVYHFHDTSALARPGHRGTLSDNECLRPNGENLAAFLYRVRQSHPDSYVRIRDVARLAVPLFEDFDLRAADDARDQIRLEWRQQGTRYPFLASQLSDGTLRFICLAAALLQPDPPPLLVFDEPELGLHPYALHLVAELLKRVAVPLPESSSAHCQVIASTQSATLLDEFDPEDVIVMERSQGESFLQRLDRADLKAWMHEYSLGALWRKNALGGSPQHEDAPRWAHFFGSGTRKSGAGSAVPEGDD